MNFLLFFVSLETITPKNLKKTVQKFFSCVISINVEGDLVIAKVDSTKNEIDGVDIEGFPTIKMFKKESNEEVEYIGRIIVVFLWV